MSEIEDIRKLVTIVGGLIATSVLISISLDHADEMIGDATVTNAIKKVTALHLRTITEANKITTEILEKYDGNDPA